MKQRMKILLVALHLQLFHLSPNVVLGSSPNKSGGSWIGNFLGVNANDNEDDVTHDLSTSLLGGQPPIPPPPPPPPIPQQNNEDDHNHYVHEDDTNNHEKESINQEEMKTPQRHWGLGSSKQLNSQGPFPPPPPQFESSSSLQQQTPPQQGYPDDWHMHQMYVTQQKQQQQQHQYQYQRQSDDEIIQSLQSDIDSLLSHQNTLYSTIHNLTVTVQDNDQMLQFQLKQIDVLLEQVADAEAYASAESNAALEYKKNCTDLSETIHTLQSKVDELEKKCKHLEQNEKCHLEDIEKLKDKVKKKEKELENLACGVEMARLEQQKEKYKEKMEKKKRKKSRGLVSWLFDYIFFGNDGKNSNEDDTDDELEKLQDHARSTLLHALQSERNNVHELEAVLSTVQQNNSAIAEMVSSRDSLIDELNDRVAVFEEDKVVLKAALRQLQKEMKEEAPKTQKLLDDLDGARAEIESLEETIIELQSNYTQEIESLEELIIEKDNMINETDSKMSMISVYVDQLEERLASFAVARRDITIREEACKEIEERGVQISKDYTSVQEEMKKILASKDELSNLVDLMNEERLKLSQEKDQLLVEKNQHLEEQTRLRKEVTELQDNIIKLEGEANSARISLEKAQIDIEEKEVKLNELHEVNESSKVQLEQQKESLKESIAYSDSLKEELNKLQSENARISALVLSLEEKVEQVVSELEEKSSTDKINGEDSMPIDDYQESQSYEIVSNRQCVNSVPEAISEQNDLSTAEDTSLSTTDVLENGICDDEDDTTCHDNELQPPQIDNEGIKLVVENPVFEDTFIPPPPPPPQLSENLVSIQMEKFSIDESGVVGEVSYDDNDSKTGNLNEGNVKSFNFTPPPPPPPQESEIDLEAQSNNTLQSSGEADPIDNIDVKSGGNWEQDGNTDEGSKEEVDPLNFVDIIISSNDDEIDDFEVISDDDNEQPPGYYQDHFDDEERLNSFYDDKEPSDSVTVAEDEEGQTKNFDDGEEPAFPASDDESKDDIEENPDKVGKLEMPIKSSQEQENELQHMRGSVGGSSPKGRQDVPLRKLRKTFSRLTGIHGLFTPPSKPAFVNCASKSQ